MDKMIMDNFLETNYTLDAIVVIKSDLEYYIKNILNTLNSTDKTVDMIRYGISEVVSVSFLYHTPGKLYTEVLLSYLSQRYRWHKNLSPGDKTSINLNLTEIIRAVYLSLHNVTKYEDYTLLSPQLEIIPVDKVYTVYNIDLVIHNTITFKFYRGVK